MIRSFMKSTQPGPTMHKPVPMGTRVRRPLDRGTGYPHFVGTVVGIASCHVIYHYIVVIDQPIDVDNEMHSTISVPGTLLDSEDGVKNWLLPVQ